MGDVSAPTAIPPTSTSRTRLALAYRIAVRLLALCVLVNAVIAGRTLIGEWDIVVHAIIGNAAFVLALAALVLALVTRADRATVVVAGLLTVLVFAQVGLGYSGRESLDARAWHIPNGVAIFGLAVWAAARSTERRTAAPSR
jgi:hypothetical protein